MEKVGFIGHQDDWKGAGPVRMGAADELVELANKVKASTVCHRIDHNYSICPLNGAGNMISAAQSIGIHLKNTKTLKLAICQAFNYIST